MLERSPLVEELPAGDYVVLRVEDTGCGMQPAIQKKIFQRFFSTKGSAGTGIGLMATKKLIDAHQGEISFKSKENVGTEFVIRIPKGMKDDDLKLKIED